MKPNLQRKRIEQLDLATGEVIAQYNSLKEGAKAVGVSLSNISTCIAGKVKTSGGYKWRLYTGKGSKEDWHPTEVEGALRPHARYGTSSTEQRFEENLLELQSYKRKHGHINVKQSDGKLGRFVDNMRRVYKCFLEGKDTNGKILEAERVELYQQQFERLEAIGFEWFAKDNQVIWDKRVQELVAFKERHKHCQVAKRDGSLGRWVDYIRRRYRDMNRHEMSRVMREKLEDLDRLGFDWHVK